MWIIHTVRLAVEQSLLMCYKAFLLAIRRWISSGLRVVIPGLFIVLAWYLLWFWGSPHRKERYVTPCFVLPCIPITSPKTTVIVPPIETVNQVPKCQPPPWKHGSCVTLQYITGECEECDESLITNIMETFSENNNLKYDTDVIKSTKTSSSSLINYLYTHPNSTQGAISWYRASLNGTKSGIFEYNVIYNGTYLPQRTMLMIEDDWYMTDYRISMTKSIDESIIQVVAGESKTVNASGVTLGIKKFPPTGEYARYSYIVLSQVQLSVYYIAFSINAIFILTLIVSEKASGMRGYLQISGLLDSAYWTSVIVDNILLFGSVTLVICVGIGYASQIEFFTKTDPLVAIIIFGSYIIESAVFSFFLSSICGKKGVANVLAATVFLFGLAFAILFSILDNYTYLLYRTVWPNIVSIFPPFLFMKMLLDIKMFTIGPSTQQLWGEGWKTGGFGFDDMVKHVPVCSSGTYAATKCSSYAVPTTLDSLLFLLLESLILFVLSLYLENVVPSQHKANQPLWYMLTPSYWGLVRRPQIEELYPLLANETAENNRDYALEIINMTKEYRKGIFSTGTISALRPLNLKIPNSTLFVLLGHNGAGKTTIISCLLGLCRPTEGTAKIFGLDIVHDITEIHHLMGLCPQFDLYWPELTGIEHMRIFSSLKPSKIRNSKEDIQKRLERVCLEKSANKKVENYSGGMKRRLSFLMATLGDPKILVLDECTNGMDPANRQHVWDYIKELKQERLIIMATHSMEEADTLGDRIAIMAKGKLRAEGTSLHLKQQFGSGYRVSISADFKHFPLIRQKIADMIPAARVAAKSDVSVNSMLSFCLPDTDADKNTIEFFHWLETAQDEIGEKVILNWSLQNSTLSEVFDRITRKIVGEDVDFTNELSQDSQEVEDDHANYKKTIAKMQEHIVLLDYETRALRQQMVQHGLTPATREEIKEQMELEYNMNPNL